MDDKKQELNAPAEYQVCNTKYTTVPVFGEAAQKESIEDKVARLILQDKTDKGAKP